MKTLGKYFKVDDYAWNALCNYIILKIQMKYLKFQKTYIIFENYNLFVRAY